jgi:HEAT repeat protein
MHKRDTSSALEGLLFRALRDLKGQELVNLLSDPDEVVQIVVARTLQLRGTLQSYRKIVRLSRNRTPSMRALCAFIFGQYGSPGRRFVKQSSAILRSLLNDKASEVRAAAADALGWLYRPSGRLPATIEQTLLKRAKDRSASVRRNVASALDCSSGSTTVLKTLNILKRDKNPDVRKWAKWSLEDLPVR